MKAKSLIFYIIVAIPFFIQSCSTPQNLVKLQPTNEETTWLYGHEYAKDSLAGIIYEVSFDQLNGPYYLFDFDITNRSNLDILIDPQDFYFIPLNDSMQPISDQQFHAQDPEKVILNLDKEISATDARRKNNIALSIVGLGVDLATAVITSTDHNPHNDFIRTDMFDAVQVGNVANEFHASDLKSLRDSWSESTIRKTTLEPGYSMKGKVFFPYCANAKYLQLILPVDDEYVPILFQQKFIPVRD